MISRFITTTAALIFALSSQVHAAEPRSHLQFCIKDALEMKLAADSLHLYEARLQKTESEEALSSLKQEIQGELKHVEEKLAWFTYTLEEEAHSLAPDPRKIHLEHELKSLLDLPERLENLIVRATVKSLNWKAMALIEESGKAQAAAAGAAATAWVKNPEVHRQIGAMRATLDRASPEEIETPGEKYYGRKLEVELAEYLEKKWGDIHALNQELHDPGSDKHYEVDIRLGRALIEVTRKPQGKREQIMGRYFSDFVNPEPKKPVILYGPAYRDYSAMMLTREALSHSWPFIVVRSQRELDEVLSLLYGAPKLATELDLKAVPERLLKAFDDANQLPGVADLDRKSMKLILNRTDALRALPLGDTWSAPIRAQIKKFRMEYALAPAEERKDHTLKWYGPKLEVDVADYIDRRWGDVLGLNEKLADSESWTNHEIDVRLGRALIEVTQQTHGKTKQILKHYFSSFVNPGKKPVILFAPNYELTAIYDVTKETLHRKLPFIVVRTYKELDQVLEKLYGEPRNPTPPKRAELGLLKTQNLCWAAPVEFTSFFWAA